MRTIITKASKLMNLKGAVKTVKEQPLGYKALKEKEKSYYDVIHYHFDKKGNLLEEDKVSSRTKEVYTYNEKNQLIHSKFFLPYEWLVSERSYEVNEDTYMVKIGYTDVEKGLKEQVYYEFLEMEVPRMLEDEIIENFKQDLIDYNEVDGKEQKTYDSPKIQKFLEHEYVGNFRACTLTKYFKSATYDKFQDEVLTFNKKGQLILIEGFSMSGYLTDSMFFNLNSEQEFDAFFKEYVSNANQIPYTLKVFDAMGNMIIRKWNRKKYTDYENFYKCEYAYDCKGNWIKKVEIDSFRSSSLERALIYFE